MALIGLIGFALAALAIGSVIVQRAGVASSRLAHAALAFLVGTPTLAFGGLAACLLGPGLSRNVVGGLCSVAVLVFVVRGRGRWPEASGWPRPASVLERYALVLSLLAMGLILWGSLTTPLVSVDARILWSYHARLILDTGLYPAPELSDRGFMIAHPRYPPLLPIAEAFVGFLAGVADERALRGVPTLLALAAALLLLAELPQRDGRFGLLLAASFALMPSFVTFEEGGADSGGADLPLAALVLASLVAFARGAPVLAGFMAGTAALTKSEGLVLGGLLCVSALATRRPRREAFVAAAIFLAVVLPWWVVRSGLTSSGMDERYGARFLEGGLLAGLPRALDLVLEMLKTTFGMPHRAGLLPWLVLAFWATSTRRRAILVEGRLWIVPAFLAVVYLFYVVSPWKGVWQVQISFPRILLQVTPLVLWALTEPAADADPAVVQDCGSGSPAL